MHGSLQTLAVSIADVGRWRWWAADYPAVFQLEFVGVQLWSPPPATGKPPNGQYALRFVEPTSVGFLTGQGSGLPPDWPDMMHQDRLKTLPVSHDRFALDDAGAASRMIGQAALVDPRHGTNPCEVDWSGAPAIASFWAGPAGCVVAAREMKLVGLDGEVIPLDDVPGMSHRWWEYWKEYWRVRGTADALPEDYACEVTIPLKDG